MEATREEDPDLAAYREVVALWRAHLEAGETFTLSNVVDIAEKRNGDGPGDFKLPELCDALHRIAGDREPINAKRLAACLRDHESPIVTAVPFPTRPPEQPRFFGGTAVRTAVVRWGVQCVP
jgi:hypothetical protein